MLFPTSPFATALPKPISEPIRPAAFVALFEVDVFVEPAVEPALPFPFPDVPLVFVEPVYDVGPAYDVYPVPVFPVPVFPFAAFEFAAFEAAA